MKTEDQAKLELWNEAEKNLTLRLNPEDLRTAGLLAAGRRNWPSALLRLDEAAQHGIRDLQTLDALGEAAYQAKMCEALWPYQNSYRDPLVAVHMARALLIIGKIPEAREFLRIAEDGLLKVAIQAVLGVENNIETAIESMLSVESYKGLENLNFVEFWQALSPVADAAGRKDLVALAERRLKALAYDRAVTHFNQSVRLLAEGEFAAAWKLYDWRLVPGSPCPAVTAFADISMWEGESLEGKSLLVVLENGFGDQIFGLRFLKAVQAEAARVEVAAGPELAALVQESFPGVKVHDLTKSQDVKYWQNQSAPDYWCYCFSIPARADLVEPVNTAGFLTAPGNLVETYRQQIQAQNPNRLPVYGVVWHGDIRTAPMRTRAYSVQEFLHESGVLKKPCILVSLQKDATENELAELQLQVKKAGAHFINAASTLKDFSHTAAWIKCLDRMYSCDTACAHAAGALAAPTSVLIRNKSIWHWRCDESLQSIWYDSVKIQCALTPAISYMFDIRTYEAT